MFLHIDGGFDLSQISLTLASASSLKSTESDFVNERLRMIMGLVLEDTDNDNVGEEPIAMTTVELVVDASGAVVNTTTTDSNGTFMFVNVPPGVYTPVVVTNLPGFFAVTDSDGGNPNVITVNVNIPATVLLVCFWTSFLAGLPL
jgi:hypothetical protein